MKNVFMSLLFGLSSILSHGQKIYKSVQVLEFGTPYDTSDTTKYYVIQIDTNNFKEILIKHNKIAIQFWQPWCSGEKNIMPHVNKVKTKLENENYHYLLICDNPDIMNYFEMKDGKIGWIVYYFNKYGIHYPTYIVGKNENLLTYKMIISNYIQKKIKTNFFCFLLDNKSLVYQNYPYYLYKKYLK